jgi:hypothetical protein
MPHMDDLLHRIDVRSLELACLGDPQARRVDQGEEHPVLGDQEAILRRWP